MARSRIRRSSSGFRTVRPSGRIYRNPLPFRTRRMPDMRSVTYLSPAIFADLTGSRRVKCAGMNPMKTLLCLLCIFVAETSVFAQKPQLAEEVFKNVQVLKGISADEFMSTMGIFSAALGMSCEDCHASNDANWGNYALDTSPRKVTARKMIQMVAGLNKNNFAGVQMITCWTCHRGTTPPKVTPNLNTLYNLPDEPDDIITQAPNGPPVDKILDRYIQALGGADRLNRLTSFVAKGTSVGYGPEGTERAVEIFAKAPGQRTTIIHTQNGDNITVIDGTNGWAAVPLKPLPVTELTAGALEGAKFEAALAFARNIKAGLTRWRVGFSSTIDDKDVDVIQGSGPDGLLVTMYFDSQSGLLTRMLRFAN